MERREFMAIGQADLDLAVWVATLHGWTSCEASPADVRRIGAGGRAAELTHPFAPIPVVLAETREPAGRDGSTSGSFIEFTSGLEQTYRLSSLVQDPVMQQLIHALGEVSRTTRADPAIAA